ncbi:MAG TPA: SsrA-binding protein SmpB [Chloroflexia bacterium]|nr:SsrA-binding protein SmpB [Chloroflexia bacterium]
MSKREDGRRDLAVNRKAFHDYSIEETLEAGLVLVGSEIKSLRDGKANLRESYVRVEGGEAWLINAHIGAYPQGGTHFNHEPLRRRKLLLHGNEIIYLRAKVEQKGLTLVPLRIYLARGKAKLEIAVARGKKLYDKREALAERDARRDMERAVRGKA